MPTVVEASAASSPADEPYDQILKPWSTFCRNVYGRGSRLHRDFKDWIQFVKSDELANALGIGLRPETFAQWEAADGRRFSSEHAYDGWLGLDPKRGEYAIVDFGVLGLESISARPLVIPTKRSPVSRAVAQTSVFGETLATLSSQDAMVGKAPVNTLARAILDTQTMEIADRLYRSRLQAVSPRKVLIRHVYNTLYRNILDRWDCRDAQGQFELHHGVVVTGQPGTGKSTFLLYLLLKLLMGRQKVIYQPDPYLTLAFTGPHEVQILRHKTDYLNLRRSAGEKDHSERRELRRWWALIATSNGSNARDGTICHPELLHSHFFVVICGNASSLQTGSIAKVIPSIHLQIDLWTRAELLAAACYTRAARKSPVTKTGASSATSALSLSIPTLLKIWANYSHTLRVPLDASLETCRARCLVAFDHFRNIQNLMVAMRGLDQGSSYQNVIENSFVAFERYPDQKDQAVPRWRIVSPYIHTQLVKLLVNQTMMEKSSTYRFLKTQPSLVSLRAKLFEDYLNRTLPFFDEIQLALRPFRRTYQLFPPGGAKELDLGAKGVQSPLKTFEQAIVMGCVDFEVKPHQIVQAIASWSQTGTSKSLYLKPLLYPRCPRIDGILIGPASQPQAFLVRSCVEPVLEDLGLAIREIQNAIRDSAHPKRLAIKKAILKEGRPWSVVYVTPIDDLKGPRDSIGIGPFGSNRIQSGWLDSKLILEQNRLGDGPPMEQFIMTWASPGLEPFLPRHHSNLSVDLNAPLKTGFEVDPLDWRSGFYDDVSGLLAANDLPIRRWSH